MEIRVGLNNVDYYPFEKECQAKKVENLIILDINGNEHLLKEKWNVKLINLLGKEKIFKKCQVINISPIIFKI